MFRVRFYFVALVLSASVAFSPATQADPPKIKPGLWETTINVKVIGGPHQNMPTMPPRTERRCVTAKDLDQLTPKPQSGNCHVDKKQKGANTMSWNVRCEQKGLVSTGYGESTVTGNTNKGFFEIKMDGGGQMGTMVMRTDFSSHRVGGC